MTLEQYQAQLMMQGVPKPEFAAVKCPACHTVQSAKTFMLQGYSQDEAHARCGQECIGRSTDAGEADFENHKPGKAGAVGCNWAAFGLLRLPEIVMVMMPDGEQVPAFAPATPADARELYRQQMGQEPRN